MRVHFWGEDANHGITVRLLSVEPPAEYSQEVTGLLLFDAENNLLGLRLLPLDMAGNISILPSSVGCDYPMKDSLLRQNPDFVEITFAKDVRPASFLELGVNLRVLDGQLHSLKINLGTKTPGRIHTEPFMEEQI